ncbi:MAG: hypothetical protein IKQ41_09980 [Clostridia bacterium]|nr:hypothetical protein [Clostridia bacterium]
MPIFLTKIFRALKANACTGSTEGKICSVKHVEGSSTTTHYFIIAYAVEDQKFTLSQQAWRCSSYESYIGETVKVHYDPNKPKRAWAEAPGKHPYSAFM